MNGLRSFFGYGTSASSSPHSSSSSSSTNSDSATPHPIRKLYVKIHPQLHLSPIDASDPLASIIYVNDDTNPILIHNEHFTGHAVFRVHEHTGHTPTGSDGWPKPRIIDSGYFDDRKRKFSLQIEGRFRRAWNGDDVLFGAFLEKPIEVPRLAHVGLTIAKSIDPALFGDLHATKPYLCSPLLCGMNVIAMRPAPKLPSEASDDTAMFALDEMPGSIRSMSPIESILRTQALTSAQASTAYHRSTAIRRTASYCSSIEETVASKAIKSQKQRVKQHQQAILAAGISKNERIKMAENEQMELRLARLSLHQDLRSVVSGSSSMATTDGIARPLLLPEWGWGRSKRLLEHLINTSNTNKFTINKPSTSILANERTISSGTSTPPSTHLHKVSSAPTSEDENHRQEREDILRASKNAARHRRVYFNSAAHRQSFTFSPENCYSFEFTSGKADLNNFCINLGLSFDIDKYIRQPLIYEARNRTGDVVFFRVELGLM